MARIDNLQNFITDVGQAIKNKKGIPLEQKIQVRDFDTEIASIETGGSGGGLEYLMRGSLPEGSKAILTQDGDGTLKAVIPDSVTSIGSYAFYYNQFTTVVIPDSVTNIGNYAFQDNQLTSIVIPDSVTNIGSSAFQDNQLTSIVIPDSVTSISVGAFRSNKLTSIVIPDNVTNISNFTFASNQLTEIIFERNTPPTIQSGTFNYNHDLLTQGSIYVPNNAVETYKTATNYVQYASIIKPISERPTAYELYALDLFIEAGYTKEDFIVGLDNQQYLNIVNNVLNGSSIDIEFLVIPDGVTNIGSAFFGNKLTSVVIPESVITIDYDAFFGNKLTSIVIPDSVTHIGNYAFYDNQLTEIIFERNTPPTIQPSTFNNNPNLLTQGSIYVPNNSVETYKTATNLVQYVDIIKPISERP